MTIPSYTSLGIKERPLVDTWTRPMPYLAPDQTDMEGGNKRLRRKPGDDVSQIQFDILFTNAEFATFKTFVLSTLGGGVSRFTMSVWDGVAMTSKTVQFADVFQEQPMPPLHTQVTFKLWVYP